MFALPDDDDRQFAVTLARGLEILRCFLPGERTLGNRDFVERTGLSKATVSRLAFTLTELGYLRHDVEARKYRLQQGDEIKAVIVPAERASPYWFTLPALALFGLIILAQRRRQRGEPATGAKLARV